MRSAETHNGGWLRGVGNAGGIARINHICADLGLARNSAGPGVADRTVLEQVLRGDTLLMQTERQGLLLALAFTSMIAVFQGPSQRKLWLDCFDYLF